MVSKHVRIFHSACKKENRFLINLIVNPNYNIRSLSDRKSAEAMIGVDIDITGKSFSLSIGTFGFLRSEQKVAYVVGARNHSAQRANKRRLQSCNLGSDLCCLPYTTVPSIAANIRLVYPSFLEVF